MCVCKQATERYVVQSKIIRYDLPRECAAGIIITFGIRNVKMGMHLRIGLILQ